MVKKYLSPEGLEQLKKELTELKEVKRPEIIKRIQIAKEQGDLSENAEYHEAKDAQSFSEGRIMELENLVRNAVIIKDSVKDGFVNIGSIVKIDCNGKKITYHIVGTTEADPLKGKISHESPLGSAFMGKAKGDKLEITVPSGILKCKIINID